jgi:hypothetical protein
MPFRPTKCWSPNSWQQRNATLPTRSCKISVGLPQAKVIVLDALRKQRNLSDYSGDLIPDSAATECVASATDLLAHVRAWLAAHRPDLL